MRYEPGALPSVAVASAVIASLAVLGCKSGFEGKGTVSTASMRTPAQTRAVDAGALDTGALDASGAGGARASGSAGARAATGAGGEAGAAVRGGADACASGTISAKVVPQLAYACHQHYVATFAVANGSCNAVTVDSIEITSTVTSGPCNPAPFTRYSPSQSSVPAGKTVTVLDLFANPFCCGAPGCAALLSCTQHQDFKISTSAGPLLTSAEISVDLEQGCNEVCP